MTTASVVSLIVAVLTALASALSSDVQAFWASHAVAAPIVLLVWKTIALFLPAPTPAALRRPPTGTVTLLALVLAVPALAGCSVCAQASHRNDPQCVIVNAVVNCTEDAVVSVAPQFLPIVSALISSVTGGDGTVDWGRVETALGAIGVRDGLCILTAIENQYLSATRPQATPYSLRRSETYRVGLEAYRVKRWPGIKANWDGVIQ
jgi:hypothetical protein